MTKRSDEKGAPVIELYDLDKDPFELDNLLGISKEALSAKGYKDADVTAKVSEMDGRLERLLKQ